VADLLAQIERFCDRGTSHDQLAAARARLAQALDNIRGMLSALMAYANASSDQPTEVHRVGLRSAHRHPTRRPFYRGNVAAAVFFAEAVLPRLAADRVVIESQGLADGTRGRGVLRAATASLVASPVGAAR
jgi:hypothetical protein